MNHNNKKKKILKTMACISYARQKYGSNFLSILPSNKEDRYNQLRSDTIADGAQCIYANIGRTVSTVCQSMCNNFYRGSDQQCIDCMTTQKTCMNGNKFQPCCPLVAPAITCNQTLTRVSANEVNSTLSKPLSVEIILVIIVASLLFILGIIYFATNAFKKQKTKKPVQEKTFRLDNKKKTRV